MGTRHPFKKYSTPSICYLIYVYSVRVVPTGGEKDTKRCQKKDIIYVGLLPCWYVFIILLEGDTYRTGMEKLVVIVQVVPEDCVVHSKAVSDPNI